MIIEEYAPTLIKCSHMDNKPTLQLSVVVPCYNEEAVISKFLTKIQSTLDPIGITYELLFVNDGSKDKTLELLLEARDRDERIKVIDLSRNFGKEAALSAAMAHAVGQAVIPIDADLQEPPELIPEMLKKWEEGYEMVTARRTCRESDGFFKRTTARSFYKLFNLISRTQLPYDTGDFRLLDRKVVEAFLLLPERKRFMKGIFAWLGFKQTEITFARDARVAGKSKFSPWKLWSFGISSIFVFSVIPLRIWSYVGTVVSSFSFLYATFLIARTLIWGRDVPGYASMMVVLLFLGGIQLIGIGVLGEYLGHVYEEVKKRPLYLVRSSHGLEAKDSSKEGR